MYLELDRELMKEELCLLFYIAEPKSMKEILLVANGLMLR